VDSVVALIFDISARKQAENALRESESHLRVLFEQAGVGVAQIETITGRFVRINQKYCDIVGYTRAEMEKLDFQAITHPDDLQPDLDNMERLRAGEIRKFAIEKRYRTKSGKTVWVNLTVSAMWAVGETPDYHIGIVEDITERKRAEAALRKSEARFAAIFHTNPVRVAITRFEDGLFLDVNDNFLTTSGYERAEVIGHTSHELNNWVHPAEQIRLRDLVEKHGLVRNFEAQLRQKSGQARDLLMSADMIELSGERCILSVAVDITERKEAEDALRASETRFRSIFEKTTTGYALTTPDGGLLRVNAALAEMLGYNIDELQQLTFQDITHPDDIDISRTSVRGLLAGNQDTDCFEKRYRHRNGSAVWAVVSTTLLRDAQNTPLYFITSVTDLTERKQAEESLRQSEERLRSYIDHAPIAVFIADENGAYLEVNPAAARITGYSAAELRQMRILDLLPPESHPAAAEHFQNMVKNGQANGEMVFRHKTGHLRYWSVDAVSLSPTRFMGFAQDITERKQAEAAVIEKANDLERFNNLMVGRELRMIELKQEVNALCAGAGQPPRYALDFVPPTEN
jgi:PAS domain S-box-containing protein